MKRIAANLIGYACVGAFWLVFAACVRGAIA